MTTGKLDLTSLIKNAAADPAQTILITGHSGSGKTTLSKHLAEKLSLPLHRVDAQTSWDDLRAHFEKNPELERKALTPGTAENKQYIKDVRKIVHRSLKEINGPAVLEGTQLTTLPAKQLAKYKANILVGGDINQSIAQRLQRMTDKAAKKGITLSPEQLAKKREESQLVAGSWHPGMEKFKKLPGVLSYNHTEHQIDPLVEQLQHLTKAAVAAWQRSEGKNPEGGLNAKGRASYKKETGGTLKAPVTESNPSGERAGRQKSFCSRMCGMKSKNTGSKSQSDPDSRINKSLRKWNCKCGEDHSSLFEKVACLIKESKGRCWEGYEPVPGKEPYSNDSCRPKPSKKKKPKLEKEAYAMDPQAFPMREASFNSPAENIGSLLFGGNFVPSPRDGESIYDSMLRNKRSIELSKLQGNALAGNPILNRLGLPNNDITKAIGRGAAMFSPQIGEKMSPLLGGNPVQAVKNMMAKQAGLDLMQQAAHYLPAVGGLAAGYASTNLLPKLYQGIVNPMMRKIAPLRAKHTNEMRANLGLQNKVKVLKPKKLNVPKGEDQYAMFDPNTNTVEASSMRMFRPGNIAHELGHAHIEHNPGVMNYLQNEIYPIADKYAKRTAPLIGAAAGLASNHHPLAGAVMGGLGGALADSGRLIPELEATRRGIKAMMQSSLPLKEKLKNSASLIPAYLSYLGQSAGSGAIAGGIAGI